MKLEEIKEYCINKYGATETYPFGEIPICYKVAGKIFAELYPREDNYKITLKCEPELADFYRQQYKDVVVRGYHCPPVQQPYHNTIYIERIEKDVLLNMIDHSYGRVLAKLTKKEYYNLIGSVSKEHILSLGGIYIEHIQEGFEWYHNEMLEGTEIELLDKIEEMYEQNGNEDSYVDFYYGKLSYEERNNLKGQLSTRALAILETYERLKEPVFLTLNMELLDLTAELNAKELLFSTYYFCRFPCTIWGNYNLSYPVFTKRNNR